MKSISLVSRASCSVNFMACAPAMTNASPAGPRAGNNSSEYVRLALESCGGPVWLDHFFEQVISLLKLSPALCVQIQVRLNIGNDRHAGDRF
jgi:hypothetical protein